MGFVDGRSGAVVTILVSRNIRKDLDANETESIYRGSACICGDVFRSITPDADCATVTGSIPGTPGQSGPGTQYPIFS